MDKQRALTDAIAAINKAFGDGSAFKLADAPLPNIDVIPTGAATLDMAIGAGGIPRGRITEIYGPEASGKTTLALSIIANAQGMGLNAAVIDVEHAIDPNYAKAIGVDTDNLVLSQPDTAEQALEIVEVLTRSGGVDVIVVDSVAALVPRVEVEGEMGDQQMGLQARLLRKATRKLIGPVAEKNVALIFINQITYKIGFVMGNPETTPGGTALRYASSVRIAIRAKGEIVDSKSRIGVHIVAKVVKNKLAPPFKEATFDIYFGKGVDSIGCLVDAGIERGIIEKSGTWLLFDGHRTQGAPQMREYLRENHEVALALQLLLKGADDGN